MQSNMSMLSELTLREARDICYKELGLPKDGGISKNTWSPIGYRNFKVYLPNFKWRRKAIPFHDLHHIITGYQFCLTGEFQIAAWEFAAGKYPNLFTTLFCIPLVSMGAVLIPRKQLNAFTVGRRSKTLYLEDYEDLLNRTINDVRNEILPTSHIVPNIYDYFEYIKLIILSSCVVLSPFFLIIVFI